MADDKDSDVEEKIRNRADVFEDKRDFELKHGFRNTENKIGGYWKYDHKITSAVATLLVSMAVITRQSVFSYIYIIGVIKVLKDTGKSGFTSDGFYPEKLKAKPLIYYLLAASIVVVAAITSNHFIPGIEGGLTYYGGQLIQ